MQRGRRRKRKEGKEQEREEERPEKALAAIRRAGPTLFGAWKSGRFLTKGVRRQPLSETLRAGRCGNPTETSLAEKQFRTTAHPRLLPVTSVQCENKTPGGRTSKKHGITKLGRGGLFLHQARGIFRLKVEN